MNLNALLFLLYKKMNNAGCSGVRIYVKKNFLSGYSQKKITDFLAATYH